MRRNTRGVAVKGINIGYLRKIEIPIPEQSVQDGLEKLYIQADKSKFNLRQAIKSLEAIYKRILSENLG